MLNPLWSPEYTGQKPSLNDMGAFELNPDHILNKGLLGWWPLNERAALLDTRIHSLTKTFVGVCYGSGVPKNYPYFICDEEGSVLYCDTNSWVYFPDDARLKPSVFSLVARIKIAGSSIETIWGNLTAASTMQFRVNSSDKLELLKAGVASIGQSDSAIPTGEYVTIGVTYDSSGNYKFFVNGPSDGSGTNLQTFDAGTNPQLFGKGGSSEGFYPNTMAWISFWDWVLPDNEMMEAHLNIYGTPDNPRILIPSSRAWFVPSAAGPSNLKTLQGLAKANVSTIHGLSIGSVKTIHGLN